MSVQSLMILIAGPYRSGTGDDPARMASNLRAFESIALPLFRAGHLPLIGEWIALPLLREAGSKRPGDGIYNEILDPAGHRLLSRCDAILRLPGKGLMNTFVLRKNMACWFLTVLLMFQDVPTRTNRQSLTGKWGPDD